MALLAMASTAEHGFNGLDQKDLRSPKIIGSSKDSSAGSEPMILTN
jgi:hypothetical protein